MPTAKRVCLLNNDSAAANPHPSEGARSLQVVSREAFGVIDASGEGEIILLACVQHAPHDGFAQDDIALTRVVVKFRRGEFSSLRRVMKSLDVVGLEVSGEIGAGGESFITKDRTPASSTNGRPPRDSASRHSLSAFILSW
jgi:hypothetical protein